MKHTKQKRKKEKKATISKLNVRSQKLKKSYSMDKNKGAGWLESEGFVEGNTYVISLWG